MDNSNATFAFTTEQTGEIIQEDGTGLDFYDTLSEADKKKVRDNNGHNDPHSVCSRTGYVILVNDAPVVWSSKLQTSREQNESIVQPRNGCQCQNTRSR